MPEPDVTQTVEPTAEPTSVVNTDGSFSENWTDKYGEENKAHLSRYKDLDSLVNSHISQRKKFSKDPSTLIEIPREGSTDEVNSAWAKAHGVPDTIDGYKYELSNELATKLGPLDDKKMAGIREFAQKKNWSPTDFKDALDLYHNMMVGDIGTAQTTFNEKQTELQEAGVAELKKEWLGEYDNKVLNANAVLRKYGGEEAVAEFNAQNSPKMAKFLDNIHSAMSEDTIKGLSTSAAPTATNIKSRIADIRASMDAIMKESPSNFKANAKFKELQIEKTELYKKYSA